MVERALVLSGGGARGAFQAGVIQYLAEAGWAPDLICGTSVGAVNAVAMGTGMSPPDLIRLWKSLSRRRIYLRRPARLIRSLFGRKPFASANDIGPMRALLAEHLDISALRNSRAEIIISAVNMATSEPTWFHHSEIEVDHVAASAAIPILFPWQTIGGDPYWDGGVMQNTPIGPALTRGARDIIVVLLSPIGAFAAPTPASVHRTVELAFEQLLIGSYKTFLAFWQTKACVQLMDGKFPRITTVCPTRMLGFRSFLNFSSAQASRLIREGYAAAREQLKHI